MATYTVGLTLYNFSGYARARCRTYSDAFLAAGRLPYRAGVGGQQAFR